MRKLFYFIINLVIVSSSHAQHITDFFTYYLYNFSQERFNYFGNIINNNTSICFSHYTDLVSDNENIYYINLFAGDIYTTTYFNDTFIKEKPFNELKESYLYFCKYNYKTHKINILPFGSNYDNRVLNMKMDKQKKRIFAVITTSDDTVRLDPTNQNNYIPFADRKQRSWLLTFNLEGKLLSHYLFAIATSGKHALGNDLWYQIYLSNFDFEGDIVLGIHRTNNTDVKLLPMQYGDTLNADQNDFYFICYSQKSNNIKWIRKLNIIKKSFYNNYQIINSDVNGIGMIVNIHSNKDDSLAVLLDENDKIIKKFEYKNTEVKPQNQFLNYVCKIDLWGNVTPLLTIESKQGASITSIIQNENDILAIVNSNDSFELFDNKYLGEFYDRCPECKYFSLLKIDLNKQTSIELIKPNDSIPPIYLKKAKRGFYITYLYNNTSSDFNIIRDDTIINYTGGYYKSNKFTICKYDTNYRILWINKTTYIASLDDHGENMIIKYATNDYDIDFMPERTGNINPIPNMMAAIYNCKPISYYKSEDIGKNTVKFTNLGEYNCSYKWDFGDGTSTTQKSPYHKFASKTQSYKVSLITTNSCGSDTFYRYYSFSAGLTSFKYNSQIKIYPNPIRGNTIKIEMPENTEIKSVKIYSPTGQQLDECSFDKTEKTNYTATIGSKLSKGIYYVKIILDDNTGYVTKVIID